MPAVCDDIIGSLCVIIKDDILQKGRYSVGFVLNFRLR